MFSIPIQIDIIKGNLFHWVTLNKLPMAIEHRHNSLIANHTILSMLLNSY